jgi:outer membrane protein assembly factor BamB
MKTILSILLVFCFCAPLAAFVSENPVIGAWSLAQATKQRQGSSTSGRALTGAGILWTNTIYTAAGQLWGGAPRAGSPVTDNQYIYLPGGAVAANGNANIMALDMETGAKVWGTSLDAPFAFGTPVVSPTRVYVATCNDAANTTVACLDKSDGTIIWTNKIDLLMAGGLLLSNDKLIFGSKWNDAGLHCLDTVTGTQIWKAALGSVSFWPDAGPALSPNGQVVYVRHNGSDDPSDFLAAVDINVGTTIWQVLYPKTGNGTEGLQPAVDNSGNIYCGFQGVSSAGDPDIVVKFGPSGTALWTYTFAGDVWETRGGLALNPDQATLYVAHNGTAAGITALNTANGTLKWANGAGNIRGTCVVGVSNIVMGVFDSGGSATAKGIKDNGASGVMLWEQIVAPLGGWLGGSGGNPCILTNGDLVVGTAYGTAARLTYQAFVSPTNRLRASASAWWGGSITVNPPGEWYLTGTVITVTATTAAGNRFTGWSGSVASMQNPLIVTMEAASVTLAAGFDPLPVPFANGQVWENFNTLWYNDGTWWGTAPNSESRQLYYTNVDSRSCLAYHLIDCGSNAQLHTDFGMWPFEFSNNTDFVAELWTPNMGATYTVRSLCKTDADVDHASGKIDVSSEGWKTIAATMTVPEMPASLLWWPLGGFPKDAMPEENPLPAGQTVTFFLNKAYFTGGVGYPYVVDDFEINPTCVGNGNWAQHPRNWRYDTASDYTYFPYQNKSYSAVGVDPTGITRTGLCLVINFDALQSVETYARAWTDAGQPLYADLSQAVSVEADVMLTCSNATAAPVKFWFYNNGAETMTGTQPAPTGTWQHLNWILPGGTPSWTNVARIGVMVETTDAGVGTLYLDNITFVVPEPALAAGLLLVLLTTRRRC